MTRLLFWIALIILVVMAVRSKLRAALNANQQAGLGAGQAGGGDGAFGTTSGRVADPVAADPAERMACCAACGLHFPASEAVTAGGREYCSPAHAQAHSHGRPAP